MGQIPLAVTARVLGARAGSERFFIIVVSRIFIATDRPSVNVQDIPPFILDKNMQTWISYLRVSTTKQGIGGLGMEAQREAVTTFATARRGEILAEYVEVESGKRNERPALTAAIAHAKRTGSILLIAKLDRLARSVSLISSLMEAKVEFQAVDMPDANKFIVHIMAAVAEHEREQISARTKAALAAAKARGVVLGANGRNLADKAIAEAIEFAAPLEGDVREIIRAGARNLREVAAGLNARGIPSRLGGQWWPSNASALMHRLGLDFAVNCAARG